MDAFNQSYILSGPQDDAIEEQNERLIDQLSQKVSRMKSVMKKKNCCSVHLLLTYPFVLKNSWLLILKKRPGVRLAYLVECMMTSMVLKTCWPTVWQESRNFSHRAAVIVPLCAMSPSSYLPSLCSFIIAADFSPLLKEMLQ